MNTGYDVTIDVDGVLLDIHSVLETRLQKIGFRQFSLNDMLTYDFNQSLSPRHKMLVKPMPPIDIINNIFNDPSLFSQAKCDWDSIMAVRNAAEHGMKFCIYTLVTNMETMLVKKRLFNQWFGYTPNVDFKYAENVKIPISTKIIIEDSHINLRRYPDSTYRYLVNKSYNQLEYNPDYGDVFYHNLFSRYATTYDAVRAAVRTADEFIRVY